MNGFKINATASGSVPLVYADENLLLERVILLPYGDLSAHGSNYWTLRLVRYDEYGTEHPGIAFSDTTTTWSTDTQSLTVGTPVLLPQIGVLNEYIQKGQSLYLELTKFASAAALQVQAFARTRSRERRA